MHTSINKKAFLRFTPFLHWTTCLFPHLHPHAHAHHSALRFCLCGLTGFSSTRSRTERSRGLVVGRKRWLPLTQKQPTTRGGRRTRDRGAVRAPHLCVLRCGSSYACRSGWCSGSWDPSSLDSREEGGRWLCPPQASIGVDRKGPAFAPQGSRNDTQRAPGTPLMSSRQRHQGGASYALTSSRQRHRGGASYTLDVIAPPAGGK